MTSNRFQISMFVTFLVNIACVLITIFGGKSDMCNPGLGFLFGLMFFAPMTVIGLIISGAVWLDTKGDIAKGIAIAEASTIIALVLFLLVGL